MPCHWLATKVLAQVSKEMRTVPLLPGEGERWRAAAYHMQGSPGAIPVQEVFPYRSGMSSFRGNNSPSFLCIHAIICAAKHKERSDQKKCEDDPAQSKRAADADVAALRKVQWREIVRCILLFRFLTTGNGRSKRVAPQPAEHRWGQTSTAGRRPRELRSLRNNGLRLLQPLEVLHAGKTRGASVARSGFTFPKMNSVS